MCTFFSSLRRLNWSQMDSRDAAMCWKEAVSHLEFSIELYREQMEAGRVFLHEHPLEAASWELEAIQMLCADPRITRTDALQCLLNVRIKDVDGQWQCAQKATGCITNSRALASQLQVRCRGDEHEEAEEVRGAARAAEYPRELRCH